MFGAKIPLVFKSHCYDVPAGFDNSILTIIQHGHNNGHLGTLNGRIISDYSERPKHTASHHRQMSEEGSYECLALWMF